MILGEDKNNLCRADRFGPQRAWHAGIRCRIELIPICQSSDFSAV